MGYWKDGVYYFGKDYDKDSNPSPAEQAMPDYIFGDINTDGIAGSIIDGFGSAIFGEGFGDLNLGESLKSWLDSMSGAELTNAQKEMNAFNSAEAEKQRDFASSESALQRDFASKEAEAAFARQEEFYNKYQSIGAQVRQYQANGLNPALLAGGVSVGSTPSSPAASSSAPSSSSASGSSPSSNPMALVSFIMQLAGIKSQIEKTKAETDNINADTDLKGVQITATESEIDWKKKNIEVMDNEIAVGNSIIQVNGSQYQLNLAKEVVERLNATQVEQMLPLIKEYTQAQTEEAEASAALAVAQAVGIKVHSEVEKGSLGLEREKVNIMRKKFGLDVADTVVDSVSTAVSTGAVILDIIGEVFGVTSLSSRFDNTTVVRDKNGNVVRSIENKGTGSRNGTSSRKRRRR